MRNKRISYIAFFRYIFGKFNSFCIRMENLLSMFEQIGLFKELFQNRMEALLSEESGQLARSVLVF